MRKDTATAIFDRLDEAGLRVSLKKVIATTLTGDEAGHEEPHYSVEVTFGEATPEEFQLVGHLAAKYDRKIRSDFGSVVIA